MMKTRLVALLALVSLSAGAFAEETTSATTTTTNSSTVKVEKKEQGDIDNEITNARMRADAGSKSKHSLSLDVGYDGGNLTNPTGKTRRDIIGSDTPEDVGLSIDFSYRYRLSPSQSLTLGSGLSIVKPFHEPLNEDATILANGEVADRYSLSSPGIGYTNSYKVGDAQMSTSVSATYYTDSKSLAVDKVASVGASQTMLGNIGTSPLQVGLYVGAAYYFSEDTVKSQDNREMFIYAAPFAEYSFNDLLSLRTVVHFADFSRKKSLSPWSFNRLPNWQSLGLAISPTRDIYLYPNLQWSLDGGTNIENTTVGMSGSFNVF